MQKIDVGCGAYKGLSDHFHESHSLYSTNGKFLENCPELSNEYKEFNKVHGQHLWDSSE